MPSVYKVFFLGTEDKLDLMSVPVISDVTICFPLEHQDNVINYSSPAEFCLFLFFFHANSYTNHSSAALSCLCKNFQAFRKLSSFP